MFEIDQGYKRLCEIEALDMINTLLGDVHKRYASLRGFTRPEPSFFAKLKGLVDACMLRAVSVHTDETLCLAALPNLDMAPISESCPEARTGKLLTMLPALGVPICILQFSESQPKQPFRWVPRSF